ncbi:MAG: formamidase [Pseudonocardia sp.]|nr:formamidase [Pseudonocardia sp.]
MRPQGDGEITFCGAIEMGGFIDFHVDLIKGGMETHGVTTNPILMPGNYYNDATVAYRNACLNAISYLEKFGYSGPQAYLLLGSAPIEGRVSGVVDIPNACCSLSLPTAIFDFDITPSAAGPSYADRGSCAISS